MKKLHINAALLLLLSGTILFSGCRKFDELNANPDAPLTVTSEMLATYLILDVTRGDLARTKGFMQPFLLDKSIIWTEFAEAMQYNDLGGADFGGFPALVNVEKMIGLAPEGKLKNSFTALGHFVSAWRFYNKTIQVGDIPYSEALMGESSALIKPKYDSQKEVFVGILNQLDEADELFADGIDFDGDPVYGGDVTKWRKLVNSFELKVLLTLVKKTGDANLNVVTRFNDIVNNRPLMTGNDDNFALVYSDATGQTYPFAKPNNFSIYPMMTDVVVDKLKQYQDRRVFYYANPSSIKIAGGKTEQDYEAYVGVDPSLPINEITAIKTSKDFSAINDRYYLPTGEPVCLLSYAELKFILAEAAVRGWITGDGAAVYYADGIRKAMEFTAANTPDDPLYHHNMKITPAYIATYLLTPGVVFGATTDEQLKQIMNQKFLANFLHSPLNAFYDNRRTGYPVLPINSLSNQNIPSDKMPTRWRYPQVEYDYNSENVNAAVDAQFSSDDENELMWILKD